MTIKKQGSLACVGTGMKLGAHISPASRQHIIDADRVFVLVSSGIVEQWIQEMNPHVVSLQGYYKEGKSRLDTYKEMVELILDSVRQGKKVCAAFYGHPGVFAWVPHKAIETARKEGFAALMEPGISAEDCLYADLGIDPGTYGCQHYEASKLLFEKKIIDNSSWLIIWQIGVVGDKSLAKFLTGKEYRKIFVDYLSQWYSYEHQVIIYESALLAIEKPRIEFIRLIDLIEADVSLKTTLVIKPTRVAEKNNELLEKLGRL